MPPRSIWKGSITFGLITIPVKLYAVVGRTDDKLDLHLLHEKDGEPIHYERRCEKGHKDIDWSEIVRGYEYEKGRWVTLDDEDLEALDLPTLKVIDVVTFAPLEQIDPVYFDKPYYVVPEESAVKAYRLMMEALEDEGYAGICKVAIREREHLSALRVEDNLMVLHTMRWPEEIRDTKFDVMKKRPKVQDRERKMARQLISQLAGDFDPSAFKDEYHKALKKLINKKIKGQDIVIPERKEEPPGVIDLMEALKASVDAAKRGEKPTLGKQTPKKKSSKKSASAKRKAS